MKLLLIRHGDADADIPEGLGDEARALVSRARSGVASHFAGLERLIGPVDQILTSPLVRCVQTAQILSIALGFDGSLKVHRALLPDMPVGALDEVMREHPGKTLILVGHQPSMGAMAANLLGLQAFPKAVNPATVIGLEVFDDAKEPAERARLLFYAPPGQGVSETL